MTFETFVTNYGYLALFVGAFLEGEATLILGGIAAHEGLLGLPWVMVSTFLGCFASDVLFFLLGRLKGKAFIERRPRWQGRLERVHQMVDRYHMWVFFTFRFMYGLLSVIPLVFGTSRLKTSRFLVVDVVSALFWASGVVLGGYVFGAALGLIVRQLRHVQVGLIAAAAALLLAALGFVLLRRRKAVREPERAADGKAGARR